MIFRYQPILSKKQLTLFSATLSLDVVAGFPADRFTLNRRTKLYIFGLISVGPWGRHLTLDVHSMQLILIYGIHFAVANH